MPKVKLIKRSKVWLDAGETVVVSPADANFLIAVGSAEPVAYKSGTDTITEQIEKPAKTTKAKK